MNMNEVSKLIENLVNAKLDHDRKMIVNIPTRPGKAYLASQAQKYFIGIDLSNSRDVGIKHDGKGN